MDIEPQKIIQEIKKVPPTLIKNGFTYIVDNVRINFCTPTFISASTVLQGCKTKNPLQYTQNVCDIYNKWLNKLFDSFNELYHIHREAKKKYDSTDIEDYNIALKSLIYSYLKRGGERAYIEDLCEGACFAPLIDIDKLVSDELMEEIHPDGEYLGRDMHKLRNAMIEIEKQKQLCASLNDVIKDKVKQLREQKLELKERDDEICRNLNRLEDMRCEIGLLEGKVRRYEIEYSNIKSLLETISVLEGKVAQLNFQVERFENLKRKYLTAKVKINKLIDENNELCAQKDNLIKEGVSASLVKKDILRLEKNIRRLEQESKQFETSNQSLKKENEILKVNLAELSSKLEAMPDPITVAHVTQSYELLLKKKDGEIRDKDLVIKELKLRIEDYQKTEEILGYTGESLTKQSNFDNDKKMFIKGLRPGINLKEHYANCFNLDNYDVYQVNGVNVTKGLRKIDKSKVSNVDEMIKTFCTYNDFILLGEILKRRVIRVFKAKTVPNCSNNEMFYKNSLKNSILNITSTVKMNDDYASSCLDTE